MMVIAAIWTMRLTKFPAVRKLAFCDWKTIAMRIRPTMIGSEPRSPVRTPAHQRRAVVGEGLVGRVGDPDGRRVRRVDGGVVGAHAVTSVWTAPGTFDSAPAVIASTTCVWVASVRLNSATFWPRRRTVMRVRDLEDVVQVVGDQDDGEALLAEALDEVEHLAGLRDAERRGRLVEDHDASSST